MKKSELEVGQILFWQRKADNMCTIDKVLSIDTYGFYIEILKQISGSPLTHNTSDIIPYKYIRWYRPITPIEKIKYL